MLITYNNNYIKLTFWLFTYYPAKKNNLDRCQPFVLGDNEHKAFNQKEQARHDMSLRSVCEHQGPGWGIRAVLSGSTAQGPPGARRGCYVP